jgi:hypothetical protein
MCISNNGERKALKIRNGPDGASVWCPNGHFAPLSQPAPDTCLYLLEHTLIGSGAVPMPIVDGDD